MILAVVAVVAVCRWGLDGEVSSAESSCAPVAVAVAVAGGGGGSGCCRSWRIWLFPFHYVLVC